MADYIMALDAGTTSNRCILFNKKGETCSMAQREFHQYFPQPGWVEHDADEIWASMLGVTVEAMNRIGVEAADIAAIGITNQREKPPLYGIKRPENPLPTPLCGSAAARQLTVIPLKEQGYVDSFRKKTGLVIDAYFPGPRSNGCWTMCRGARERAEKGELLFGTVETWLIWKLTKGAVHVTDYSNASRTMLFNINTLQWDEEILKVLDIPKCMLPEPKPSSCIYGETDPLIWADQFRLPGRRGTSRRRCSGRPVLSRVRPRTPTERAASFL